MIALGLGLTAPAAGASSAPLRIITPTTVITAKTLFKGA